MKRTDLTPEQMLTRIEAWCAGDERCSAETRRKLRELGALPHEAETLTDHLIDEGFVDDARFASLFARSKFNSRHWGRRRIEAELKMRHISRSDISNALATIDEDSYFDTLVKLAEQKMSQLGVADSPSRQKAFRYLMQKGYEPALIGRALNTAPDETDYLTE